jgi:hypothetical protein
MIAFEISPCEAAGYEIIFKFLPTTSSQLGQISINHNEKKAKLLIELHIRLIF